MMEINNLGTLTCFLLAFGMFAVALFFQIGKEKSAKFISGFSSFSQEQRQQYDQKQMSLDMKNLYLQLALILLIGACLSLIHQYFAIGALILWLIRFFMDVHLDEHQAFDRYKK